MHQDTNRRFGLSVACLFFFYPQNISRQWLLDQRFTSLHFFFLVEVHLTKCEVHTLVLKRVPVLEHSQPINVTIMKIIVVNIPNPYVSNIIVVKIVVNIPKIPIYIPGLPLHGPYGAMDF